VQYINPFFLRLGSDIADRYCLPLRPAGLGSRPLFSPFPLAQQLLSTQHIAQDFAFAQVAC
jgi:hypothetical protein